MAIPTEMEMGLCAWATVDGFLRTHGRRGGHYLSLPAARCPFDIKQLTCKSPDDSSCPSAAQVQAAEKLYAGASNSRTKELIYPGMAFGSELRWDPVNGLASYRIAESYSKHVVFKDEQWDYRTLDFDAAIALSDQAGTLLNATDPNLRPFFARGGKLIQYHGWSDSQISPISSVNYYKSVEAKLGRDEVGKSYRLFMVPGMDHCGGGEGPNQFNPMSALERWREQNIAPNEILASHVTDGIVDTTRPLCPYPQLAV